jgi:mono/diheme cytochrome c family protein
MSKRTFILFGLLVALLVVLIPWIAFRTNGDPSAGAESAPADLKGGQSLFQTNCGACHTLYAAGTDGNFAPNLDQLLAPAGPPSGSSAQQTIESTKVLVLSAIEEGFESGAPGRMPPGILSGAQAEEVAEFVARTAGEGSG